MYVNGFHDIRPTAENDAFYLLPPMELVVLCFFFFLICYGLICIPYQDSSAMVALEPFS